MDDVQALILSYRIISYIVRLDWTQVHSNSHVNKMQIQNKTIEITKCQTKIVSFDGSSERFHVPDSMSEGRAFHAEGPACE